MIKESITLLNVVNIMFSFLFQFIVYRINTIKLIKFIEMCIQILK